jgi:chitinase
MLELAYWIGPRPGVENGNAALDHYRERTQGASRDRFVVMHLHMNENLRMLRTINGHTYMGVQRITVFHGQNPRFQNGAWRVENGDFGGLNSRDGWDCPESDSGGQEWYIGSPRDNSGLSGPDQEFFTTLQTWAQNLYTAGYTGTAGQQLIFQGTASLPNGDIDPAVPPFLVHRGGRSDVAGGQDPYLLSWTVSDHGPGQRLYDFAPQPPPSI